ncbi:MAG: SCP-like extracellular [Sphingomonas sp.]|nr:SCP-like extracellular [Sphingomonas sp.]
MALTVLPPQSVAPPPVVSLDPVSRQLLDAHNRERAMIGAPSLQWDPNLARAAISYGPALAAAGRLQHSPRESRPGQRENLWRGTSHAYLPAQMVASWADEKRYFRPGVFPAVSTTGDWLSVSHYTQMIWPTTTRVGCGVYRTPQWDYLICRYSPPGNVDGRTVGVSPGERG